MIMIVRKHRPLAGAFYLAFFAAQQMPAQEPKAPAVSEEPVEQQISATAQNSISWQTDLDDALDEAEESKKPILLYFSASWCQPCQLLKSTTLRDPAVIDLVSPYLKVQIDYDSDAYLVARYGITGVPAVLLLDSAGELVATSVGYRDTEQFQDWLARHAENVAPEAAVLAAQARNQLIQSLEEQLATDDPAEHVAALTRLFEECVQKNIVAMTFARKTLGQLATDNPGLLRPFLRDPRLLVRIMVGNALTSADPELEFDPWMVPAKPG